ncbi:hypothetical protein NPIL_605151, partial [Nephila pilipes]
SGGLSLCDKLYSGQPLSLDDEALLVAIEEDSSLTCGGLVKSWTDYASWWTGRQVLHDELLATGHLTLCHPITTTFTPWTIIFVENILLMKQTCAHPS